VWTAVDQTTFQCMYNNSKSVAFVRIYTPDSGGKNDSNGVNNVVNALAANLGVEVFVQPAPQSSKTGAQQFDEAYNYMDDNQITFGTIWLIVTQPNTWSTTPSDNTAFISSFLDEARSYNKGVGIYTSWYDWYLITNYWDGVEANGPVHLWYWNVLGLGSNDETVAGFSDFRSFGSWDDQPAVKQYGIIETVCGVTVNVDVFKTPQNSSSSWAADSLKERNKKLVAARRSAIATPVHHGGEREADKGDHLVVGENGLGKRRGVNEKGGWLKELHGGRRPKGQVPPKIYGY